MSIHTLYILAQTHTHTCIYVTKIILPMRGRTIFLHLCTCTDRCVRVYAIHI
jgi:hypothetical protein